MPPDSEMKNTRLSVVLLLPVGLCTWSISLKLAAPAMPALPATSFQEPATKLTVTAPGPNWPAM